MSASAVCPLCALPMDGRGCVRGSWLLSDGSHFPREPYAIPEAAGHCHDCNAPQGGYHHDHCDMDLCPHGQALGCPEECQVYVESTG